MRFKGKLVFSEKPILAYDHLACMKRRLDENLNDTVIPVFTLFYFTLVYFTFFGNKRENSLLETNLYPVCK